MGEVGRVKAGDGVEIVYEVDGAGPPLVLIHGIMENRTTWEEFLPHLTGEYRVIRVDVRGHGDSGLGGDYSVEAMCGDVAAVVRDAGVQDPFVVGHSMGGMIASFYSAAYETRKAFNIDQPLQLSALKEQIMAVEGQLRGDGFSETMNFISDVLGLGNVPEPKHGELRAIRNRGRQEVVLGVWKPLMELNVDQLDAMVNDAVRGIKAPYLSLHGMDIGDDYRNWLTGLVPQAEVECWDGLGHWLHRVDPERFLKRLKAFCS